MTMICHVLLAQEQHPDHIQPAAGFGFIHNATADLSEIDMQPMRATGTALHLHLEVLDACAGEAAATTSARSLDLAKAAKLLGDIKASEQEADLSGVDVIDAELGFLQDVSQQVREQAQVSCSNILHIGLVMPYAI